MFSKKHFTRLQIEFAIDLGSRAVSLELHFQQTREWPVLACKFHQIAQIQLLGSVRLEISRLAFKNGGFPIRLTGNRERIQWQERLAMEQRLCARLELHIVKIHAGLGQSDARLHPQTSILQQRLREMDILG